jgi:hypothetical protein
MAGVPVKYGTGEAARGPATERERVTGWRAEQLMYAGASYELTKVLAQRHDLDLTTLVKWLKGGATEDQIRRTFL